MASKRANFESGLDGNCDMREEELEESSKKRHRVTQEFRNEYSQKWPVLKASSLLGKGYSYYALCKQDIKIEHGGRDDCSKHYQSLKHASRARAMSTSKSITFVTDKNVGSAVMFAELKMIYFLVLIKHDISWGNCVSFCSDNASVMTGLHKCVAGFILLK